MKLFNYESGDFVRKLKENHEEPGTLKGEKEGWVGEDKKTVRHQEAYIYIYKSCKRTIQTTERC